MPHANVWEPHGVEMEFWGAVSADEIIKSAQEIAGDRLLDTLRFVVVDFSKVQAYTIDEATLQDIAVVRIGSQATNPNVRIALVTTDERVATLVQSANVHPFLDAHAINVFGTVAAAREWLAMQPTLSSFTRQPRFDPDSQGY